MVKRGCFYGPFPFPTPLFVFLYHKECMSRTIIGLMENTYSIGKTKNNMDILGMTW